MSNWMNRGVLTLGCILLLVGGCGVSGPISETPDAEVAEKGKTQAAEKKKTAEEDEETLQEKAEKTWSWQAREMGRTVKDQVKRCQTYAMEKISPPGASKMMPSVSLKEFRGHCEVLTTHFDRVKEQYWGSHYSVDSLIGNLARFNDAYQQLLPVWKVGKPSVELQEGLQGQVNALRTLSRSAGMVAGMELTAKPMTQYDETPITRGKLRAHVTRVAKDADGPDLEKLLDKLEAYALGPLKEGTAVYANSLEHAHQMFARRLRNRRLRWSGMKTDSPGYDERFKKVALAHLDSCDSLVDAFGTAAKVVVDTQKPSGKSSKEAVKGLKVRMEVWKASLKGFPDALGAVTD